MIYTLITGLIWGAFLGYLNLCQQIFQVQYALGDLFPLYFALLAASVGAASVFNGRLVMKLGMHTLANRSLQLITLLSWIFLLLVWWFAGQPPLWLFVLNFLAVFFCLGVLFGNLNAIAMEPMGHIAGTAAAVIGSLSTLIAVALGYIVGHAYDGTLFSVAMGFACFSTLSVLLSRATKAGKID